VSARCANAACPQVLRDCQSGRFFHFTKQEKTFHHSNHAPGDDWNHQGEYYWLCDRCAKIYTLVYIEGAGVSLKPQWKDLASGEILRELGVA
jgi:hypothetical protein